MAFLPPQETAPAKPGQAIALGSLVAVGSAFVVGLISGATNTEFAALAVLIGALVGVTMRRNGRDISIVIAATIISLAGGALSSVIALVFHIVRVAQAPLSLVLGHLSTVLADLPHYIGGLGFFFWAIGAYVGGVTAAGRMRGRRRLLGPRLPTGPYGGPGPQPYGGPGPQPYGGPGPQPYDAQTQLPFGAPPGGAGGPVPGSPELPPDPMMPPPAG